MLALLLALVACAPVDPLAARRAWVQDQLVTDNRLFLSRDPQRVAEKLDRMAADPYDYLRGSNRLWLADRANAYHERPPTAFLSVDAARATLLVGDAHPENASTYLVAGWPDMALPIEMIDLDAAGVGPYTLDLGRAALGLALLGQGLPDCPWEGCQDAAVSALAEGYAETVLGDPDEARRVGGGIFGRLRDEAEEEGPARQRLAELTVPTSEGLRLRTDTGLDAAHAGLLPLNRDEEAQARALFAALDLPAGSRLTDAARRFGVGISSLPALRYLLLVDQGSPTEEDDSLIEVRELIEPPVMPGAPAQPFDDNAERVAFAAAALWSEPMVAPGYRALCLDGLYWRALPVSSFVLGLDHLRIAEDVDAGEVELADVERLGGELGQLLAQSHLRAGMVTGGDLRPVLIADLEAGGGEDGLRAELLGDAEAESATLLVDWGLLNDLIEEEGPLLGADGLSGVL